MSDTSFIFNILCFTTDEKSFEPLKILRNYAIYSGYNKKEVKRYNPLEFYYKERTILISFHQIINLAQEKNYICCLADSYLIFLDLEKTNTFENLNEIINFMNNLCDLEKTVYIVGLYSDFKKIKDDLNEGSIKEFLENKKLLYEYFEAKIQSTNDFNKINSLYFPKNKTIDFIIEEGIKKKENKLKNQELNTKNDSESKSNCFIF